MAIVASKTPTTTNAAAIHGQMYRGFVGGRLIASLMCAGIIGRRTAKHN